MSKIDFKRQRIVFFCALIASCILLLNVYSTYNSQPSQDNLGTLPHTPSSSAELPKSKIQHGADNSSSDTPLVFDRTQSQVQMKRKALLRDTCELSRGLMRAHEGPSTYTKRHIYVIDAYKVMYCFVPKVGCSNWKRVLMVLNGEKDSVHGLSHDQTHLHTKLPLLHTFTPKEQEFRLKTYFKFFFVREPFKRALSVYRSKFEDRGSYLGNPFFHRYGKRIVRRIKKKPTFQELKTGENVGWMDFVNYLINPSLRATVEDDFHYSDHWAAMHKICSPCSVDYDVIGNLETADEDARDILHALKAPSDVQFNSSTNVQPTNSSSDEIVDRYFSQLNNIQLVHLWELYKLDYQLFGYPKPSIVPA